MDARDWDRRYEGDELLWSAEPNRFVAEEVAGMAPGRALDVACGEGRNTVWLAQQGWRATGVDFSAVGLGKARRLAQHRGVDVELVQADVLEWSPPPGAYDLVVVAYLHLPPDERRRVLRNAVRALAPGGSIVVVGHHLDNLEHGYGGPQVPEILLTPEAVVDDLGEPVEVDKAERVTRPLDTDEGPVEAIDALVRAHRPRNTGGS